MPGMNGPEMVQRMLSRRPDLKYLFISGHTANLLAAAGLDASTERCLAKPFTRALLAQRVHDILIGA
jgi:CheY-like chemotaxis protein